MDSTSSINIVAPPLQDTPVPSLSCTITSVQLVSLHVLAWCGSPWMRWVWLIFRLKFIQITEEGLKKISYESNISISYIGLTPEKREKDKLPITQYRTYLYSSPLPTMRAIFLTSRLYGKFRGWGNGEPQPLLALFRSLGDCSFINTRKYVINTLHTEYKKYHKRHCSDNLEATDSVTALLPGNIGFLEAEVTFSMCTQICWHTTKHYSWQN